MMTLDSTLDLKIGWGDMTTDPESKDGFTPQKTANTATDDGSLTPFENMARLRNLDWKVNWLHKIRGPTG